MFRLCLIIIMVVLFDIIIMVIVDKDSVFRIYKLNILDLLNLFLFILVI